MPATLVKRPRRRRRLLLRLAALLGVLLTLDKVHGLVAPVPTTGHWRSLAAAEDYRRAYDRAMAGLPTPSARLDVPTRFGTVRVLRWDAAGGGAPVVLLPGRSSGAPLWGENLPDWLGKVTIYALDPLGDAGLSQQTVPLTGPDDQADWVADALAGLRIERAHVVGHSFGGATAAMLAVRHPQRVATLTLLEPIQALGSLPASTFGWAAISQLPVPQSWRDRALAEIGGVSVEEVRQRTPVGDLIDRGAAGYVAALPMPRALTDAELRSLPMPVRVDLAGDRSLSGSDAASRARMIPRATVTTWPGATHSLPMQRHAELAPLLLALWS